MSRSAAATTHALPRFDMDAFCGAIDTSRQAAGLDWYAFARELWEQSAAMNELVGDHPLCGGAVSRMRSRGATSCQYALYMLRWMNRPPEEFLDGPSRHVGDTALPSATSQQRLRFDLPALHVALNTERQQSGWTWPQLAAELHCTPARLTNLRHAREADMALTMLITQWLRLPAARFISPIDASSIGGEYYAG